ncbi:FecR family protein [Pinirhizobacter soli]|uniref:FecR family protein n=1 Tax=Pinirhizobacter soli TaxID=2786953 RepID=UPI002029F7C5|nr:FecR domain-containing protein [Pinirhizobacter soli]
MTDANSRASRRLTEEAATWYLELRGGGDRRTNARFLAWLQRSPQHVAEYLAIAGLHNDLPAAAAAEKAAHAQLKALAASEPSVVPFRIKPMPVQPVPSMPRARASLASRPRTLRWLAVAAGVLLVFGGGIRMAMQPMPVVPGLAYASDASAPRTVPLEDGSVVELDRDSAMVVRFDTGTRSIELVRGAALFNLGKDPGRPMTIHVGTQVLNDIGTVFTVRAGSDATDVAVISGRVAVAERTPRWIDRVAPRLASGEVPVSPVVELGGGESARVASDGRLLDHGSTDIAHATAWLPTEIRFHDMPVAQVAQRFNAYVGRPLVVDDKALAAKRISGVFKAHDADAFVAYLATLPDVRVERTTTDVHVTVVGDKRKTATKL